MTRNTHGEARDASVGERKTTESLYFSKVQPYLLEITEDYRNGIPEPEIAKKYKTTISVWKRWLREYVDFSDAKDIGTEKIKTRIANAYFYPAIIKLITGYEYSEIRYKYHRVLNKLPDGTRQWVWEPVEKIETVRHEPPSSDAIKWFMSHYDPKHWGDQVEAVDDHGNRVIIIPAREAVE